MRALTASEVIQLWETASNFHPIDQALSILLRIMPEQSRDGLATLSQGRRDALLLGVRQATFGDAISGMSHCPQCGETVEFELSCNALHIDAVEPQSKTINHNGYNLLVRPLNSFDMADAAGEATLLEARKILLQRCVAEASYQGKKIDLETIPQEIEDGITETALAADPQAEMLLDINCPACRCQWQLLLDICQILWLEISSRAQRLLMEVHLLAKAYGWTEKEILKLSPSRRAVYFQMVAA